jgi:hypothetical protein
MIHDPDHVTHAILIVAVIGAVAVVMRFLVARTHGRTPLSSALGCVGVLALIIVAALLAWLTECRVSSSC